MAGADGEGTLAAVTDQRKAAANGAVYTLQIVEIHSTRGIAQIAVGVATDLHMAAHYAEQHRAIVRQHRIVVQGITNGSPRKLMSDQRLAHQFLIERFGRIVVNHARFTGFKDIARNEVFIYPGF